MEKNVLLAVVLTVLSCPLFGQSINSVTVSPQNPTSADEVILNISGDRWSSDMFISSISTTQSFNTFNVDIEFMSGGIGLPVLVPFDTIVSLGTLTIGYYDCQVNGILNSSVQDMDGTSWAVLEPTGISTPNGQENKFMCTPNPFSSETMVSISLAKAGKVRLSVFDILGQEVAVVVNEYLAAGHHRLKYLTDKLPSGRYYFNLSTTDNKAVIRQVMKK